MLLLTWPILRDPAHVLLCDPTSEAMGHLWGLEVADEGLFRHGPFVRVTDQVGFPEGFHADFMDPVDLVIFSPVRRLTQSPGLAWSRTTRSCSRATGQHSVSERAKCRALIRRGSRRSRPSRQG